MRFVKEQKRVVEVNPFDLTFLRQVMLRFRNKMLAAGKPTEDIDDLLLKLL